MSCGFQEQTVKNKNISILITAGLVLGGIGFAVATQPNKECVTVLVDYGVLDSGEKSTRCVPVDGKVNALDLLTEAGHTIEGTGKYGAQIACRVNSFPSATTPIGIKGHENYVETCAEMPAAFAYWAVLVKDGVLPWGWASTGIDQVTLEAGDSLGLVFFENDNQRFPE
jgi:hypothetical protein